MSIEQSTPSPDGEPTTRRRRPRSAVIVALAAIVIVALFGGAFALHGRAPTASAGGQPPTSAASPTIPAGWVQYTDPDGYFLLWMPPDWTATRSVGTGTEGDDTGNATFPAVYSSFGEATSNGASVYISLDVFTSDYLRRRTCEAEAAPTYSFKSNTILAGIPAYFGDYSMWLLETQNAHFQIDYRYPGSLYVNPGGPIIRASDPTATPVPAGLGQADQQLVEAVIASFRPIPDQPLSCN